MTIANQSIESLTEPVPFWKMNGSGNDFVVVDNRDDLLPEALKGEWARRVSRQHLAVGADGLVLIERLPAGADADIRWRYFNADGSEGEMCGNGAMCGARFAIETGIAPNPVRMLTESGVVRAAFEDRQVWLNMPDSGELDMALDIDGLPFQVAGHAVPVGVPHVVIPVDDADAWPPVESFDSVGRAIRYHRLFAPAGVNVNAISPLRDGAIRMRTWERGVEAETLACGTGSVASAIVAAQLGIAGTPVRVVTSSGRTLTVDFTMIGNRASQIRLGGVASVVTTGSVMPDAWMTW
ncbi:MAG: diaminopimelate epimerase [Thermomicrobiales bacterium]|nr:diaminopimelate epimerase [Thermomicrobiales bacterium]